MPSPKKINKSFLFAVAMSVSGMYLRLRWLANHPTLIPDELWQVSIMDGSFVEMWRALQWYEHSGWLSLDYVLIYPFYKIADGAKWIMAIPHILFTVLGFVYFYLICQKYLYTAIGFLAAYLIFVFNVTLIEHATNIRAYAVLPTLALMCFYYCEMTIKQYQSLKFPQKAGLGAFFIFVLWFHVYGVAMLSCSALWAVCKEAGSTGFRLIFSRIVKFGAVIVLIAAPFWLYCNMGPHAPYDFAERGIYTFEYIPHPFMDPAGFVKSLLGNLAGNKRLYFLLPALCFPFLFNYKDRYLHIGWFLTLVVLPLLMLLVGVLPSGYWFLQRQFSWVVPFFAIFLGMSWQSIFHDLILRKKKRRNFTLSS